MSVKDYSSEDEEIDEKVEQVKRKKTGEKGGRYKYIKKNNKISRYEGYKDFGKAMDLFYKNVNKKKEESEND